MCRNNFNINTVINDFSFFLKLVEFTLVILGEAKLLTDSDGLSARELHHSSSEGFLSMSKILRINSDGNQDGSNVDSCSLTEWLSEGTSHTLLESISSSTWKHFVNSENVPRVNSDSHVECVLTSFSLHVLVGSNSSGFKSFWWNLFFFSWDHVNAAWELVELSSLLSNVVNSELRIGDTSAISGFRVWLSLLISIAPERSSSHFFIN